MKTRIVFYLAVAALTVSSVAVGYPTPKVVQKVNQWTLDVKYSAPEQITLQLPNQKKPQRFWYIILSITNETSLEEAEFYPLCRLITDTFQVIDADKRVPIAVFNAIKRKHQGSYPFLESLDFKDHRVARGEDNTPKARQISLFVGGLSNETAVIEHPELKDEDGNFKKIFLQKTLQLKYAVAGDEKLRSTTKIKEIKKTWVMR